MPDEAEEWKVRYEGLAHNDDLDLDWRKDEGMVTEKRWGGAVTFVDGYVDGYSLEAVLRGGFFSIQAPVFSDPFVKEQTLFILCLTAAVAVAFLVLDHTGVLAMDANIVGQSANIFSYFSGLSGFLFGYFVFNQLSAFLTVKMGYLDGLLSAFQEILFLASAWFPQSDARTAALKSTLVRWGLACFALTCGSADPDGSPQEASRACVRRGLLSEPEAELLARASHDAMTPLLWMQRALEQRLLEGDVPGSAFKRWKAQEKLLAFRGHVGGVLTAVSPFGNQPLPLVHLMSALVKIQLFLMAVAQGVKVADIVLGETNGKYTQVLFVLLMTTAAPIIYQGLLEFVIMIRNPFGRDWLDLPTRKLHQETRDEVLMYTRAGEGAAALPSVQSAKLPHK